MLAKDPHCVVLRLNFCKQYGVLSVCSQLHTFVSKFFFILFPFWIFICYITIIDLDLELCITLGTHVLLDIVSKTGSVFDYSCSLSEDKRVSTK